MIAGAAPPAARYTLQWSRFDNDTGEHHAIGEAITVSDTKARVPSMPAEARYIAVRVTAEHPEHAAWNNPVQVYFRRDGAGWKTVGLTRN